MHASALRDERLFYCIELIFLIYNSKMRSIQHTYFFCDAMMK